MASKTCDLVKSAKISGPLLLQRISLNVKLMTLGRSMAKRVSAGNQREGMRETGKRKLDDLTNA